MGTHLLQSAFYVVNLRTGESVGIDIEVCNYNLSGFTFNKLFPHVRGPQTVPYRKSREISDANIEPFVALLLPRQAVSGPAPRGCVPDPAYSRLHLHTNERSHGCRQMKRFTQRNHLHVATDDITLGAAWNPRFAFPLKGNAPRSVSAADIQRRSRQSNRPGKKKKS